MSEEKQVRCVSFEQLQSMVDFMSQNVDLAMGLPRSMEFRHKCKKLWAELTKIMHSRSGARKTAGGWSKYWSDYKNKLKNKLRLIKIAKNKNETPSVSLTKMDKRVMSILGKNYFGKRKTIQNTNPVKRDSLKDTKIKTELCDESNEYLSDCSEGSERDVGEMIPVLNVDCERPISADLKIDEICPQWLIDSEQKRAEAELIRARAEEHRASIAAKSADAASVQAEALRKLAEAATLQAESLAKIATLLEPVAAALQRQPMYDFRQ